MTSSGPMINKSEHCNYDNPIPHCHPYSHVLTFERHKGKSRDLFSSTLHVFVRLGGLKKLGIKVFPPPPSNRPLFEFVLWIFSVYHFNGMLQNLTDLMHCDILRQYF